MSLKKSLSLSLLLCHFTPSSWAEITLDGSLGQSGALSGPDYAITADLGKQVGGNLFHSFRDFNLSQDESATFSGPNTINNIISRVTGGNPSQINGWLRSTIPDADVYLLNPAGIMFGKGAKLDVQGSFYASTANTLRLGDDGEFNASNIEQSILTVAAPSAFGFLKAKPAAITLQDSQLAVLTGKSLSLIGGDLNLNGIHTNEDFSSKLSVESGRLNLASLSSPGEVIPTQFRLDINSPTSGGTITANGTQLEIKEGGQIFIRGGELNLIDSQVKSETTGDNEGGAIAIQVGTLNISNSIDGIYSNSAESARGNSGNIEIQADQINLTEVGQITSKTDGAGESGDIIIKVGDKLTIAGSFEREGNFYVSGIYNQSFSQDEQAKPVGKIEITAQKIVLSDLGQIANWSSGTAKGGSIVIKADNLTLVGTNGNYGAYETIITNVMLAQKVNAGQAGDIQIEARQVTLKDGAAINNVTLGTQGSGPITLIVGDLLTVESSFIGAPGIEEDGKSGDIKIKAGQLTLRDGGQIIGTNVNSTEVGSIVIEVAGTLTISDANNTKPVNVNPSGIYTDSTNPGSAGNAGNIKIVADQIILNSAAEISGSIRGSGKAGNIEITAHQMKLDDHAKILSNKQDQSDTKIIRGGGEGGTIIITLDGTLTLSGSSNISTDSALSVSLGERADAGEIKITAQAINLLDHSEIRSDTTGKGGTITLDVKDALIIESSEINTLSYESEGGGSAGNIDITTRQLDLTGEGKIDSRTVSSGKGGNITLNVSDTLTVSGNNRFSGRISTDSIGRGSIGSDDEDAGDAGTISITANKINLKEGGRITSSTSGAGKGGTIELNVSDTLTVSGKNIPSNSLISSDSHGNIENKYAGDAGTISITANKINLIDGGEIKTSANNAGGGDITLTVPNSLYLQASTITTEVKNNQGNGGTIKIDRPTLAVLNNSEILTRADQGWGGGIDITADKFIRSADSLLDASSRVEGRSGEIKIEADSYVGNGLITLPESFSNPPSLRRCETQFTTQETPSHFTRANRARMRRDELKEGVWGSPLDF